MHSCDEISSLSGLGGKSLIHSVEHIRYSFLKRFPPVLVISADGRVSKAGTSGPELREVGDQRAPKEGVLELAFVSSFQGNADENTLVPIHADLEWRNSPEAVQQITVHANTNRLTRMVGNA